MNWFLNITIIAAATAVLFAHYSHAAPIVTDASILPHPYYQGQVQQDPVSDPGIGDWFSNIFNIIFKIIAKGLEDRDPKKIKAVKDYIQQTRDFASPGINFLRKYIDPEDTATKNILKAVTTYLSSLEDLVKEPSMLSHEDVKNMAVISAN